MRRLLPWRPGPRPDPWAEHLSLSVVRSEIRRGHLAGTVSPELLGPEQRFPLLCLAEPPGTARRAIWLYADQQDALRDGSVPPGAIGLTKRIQGQLGSAWPGAELLLQIPYRRQLTVRITRARDLPQSGSVHVSRSVSQSFGRRRRWRRQAIMTSADGLSFPVRLHRREIDDDWVLVPMSLRTLSGIPVRSQLQLAALPRLSIWERRSQVAQKVAKRPRSGGLVAGVFMVLGVLLTGLRFLDFLLELLLRAMLRSPSCSFRTIQANPGDDDLYDTIRLHPAAFGTLGLRPGGQAILTWGDQRIAVRALEDQSPLGSAPPSTHVLSSVGLHLDPGTPPEGFPPHLVARIPAPLRQALNIPPNTIVAVRRRLRTAVVSQLNQLTIPVGGLILAAAALPALRGWPLAAGAVSALILGLAPLRLPRPPRGHWP